MSSEPNVRVDRRYRNWFAGVLLITILFRLWFAGQFPLTGDEAYHWEWSRTLSAGYYDHPPMTAWWIRAGTALLGDESELAVRFPAILALAGTAILMFLLARYAAENQGMQWNRANRAGFLAGVMVLFVPLYAGLSLYISTDPALVFFWALTLYSAYRALTEGVWRWWVLTGVAAGLGVSSKLLILLLGPGLLLFVLLSPADRKWFMRPQPYVAVLAALVMAAPFLLWNMDNDWATFRFNFVSRQEGNAFAPKHIPEFLGSQMLAMSPGIFLVAWAGWAAAVSVWRKERNRAALYLFLCSVIPLLYFLYTSMRRRVGLHWPEGCWLALLVWLAVYWSRDDVFQFGKKQNIMRWVMGVCLGMTLILHAVLLTPAVWVTRAAGGRHVEDERFGWRDLGVWVASAQAEMKAAQGGDSKGVFLLSGQYGAAAALSFYMPGQERAHLWSQPKIHGEQYRFWDRFETLEGQDAVYVCRRKEQAEDAVISLSKHFSRVEPVEELKIHEGGVRVRSFFRIRCFGFDGRTPFPVARP